MKQPRFLMYAVDGLGLGHVTRLLGLARALRAQMPGAEVLFLTASEAAHVIYREGFAALKVPSRSAARAGGLRRDTFWRVTQSAVWNTITAFDPHCLVVDTFAAGALGELLPILRWPLRKVFVFRAQRTERAHDPLLQSTLRLYDLILVPHAAGEEDVPTPPEIRCVWTGAMLLREPNEILDRAAARDILDLPPDARVGLLALGGGGDPEISVARRQFFGALRQVCDEWRNHETDPPHLPKMGARLCVELEGPLLTGAIDGRERGTRRRETSFEHRVLRDIYPAMLYGRAFDWAVSSVGYNTTHELQAARVPSVLWPFARDLDDQVARATQLAKAGRALCVGAGTGIDARVIDAQSTLSRAPEIESAPRVDELAQALRQIARPETSASLRAAMAQEGAVGSDDWTNGTTRGARAILGSLGL